MWAGGKDGDSVKVLPIGVKKKLATARSRLIGISVLYQNIPQLQNRYPDGQWEEILGGCDISLFLGCNDMTTATYFSDRSGEVTVGVASIRKNLSTVRMSNYVPDYSETSSVGKRKLLLPDEVLRFPLDQALVIIRGQKVLRVKKMDYTRHSEAKKLVPEKTSCHIPEWRGKEEMTAEQGCESCHGDVWEPESGFESQVCPVNDLGSNEGHADVGKARRVEQNSQEELEKRESDKIERVEDLFTDEW